MNYKDFIGLSNIDDIPLCFISDVNDISNDEQLINSNKIYFYNIISESKAICGYDINSKNNYDIRNENGKNQLYLNGRKIATFNQVYSSYGIIGKIENNKIFNDYFRQGYIYKNDLVYLKTRNMMGDEINRLPLEEKICYIPEGSFNDNRYLELSDKLVDGRDYYTINSIRKDIENYYGTNVIRQISEDNIKDMIDDVYFCVDWQHPYSLLDADQYLDGFIESLNINLDEEEEIMDNKISIEEFESLYNDLKNKKLKDIDNTDIARYMIMDIEKSYLDNTEFYDYEEVLIDKELLESLSNDLEEDIFRLINEDYLEYNDIHIINSEKENEL